LGMIRSINRAKTAPDSLAILLPLKSAKEVKTAALLTAAPPGPLREHEINRAAMITVAQNNLII